MEISQSQIDTNNSNVRHKRIRIELLNRDLQVIDSLEGYAVAGSITANANNTIRRSGSLTLAVPIDKSQTTFLDQVDGLAVSYQGKVWLDKRLKIYVGIDKNNNGTIETVWNKMGVFLMDKPSRIISSQEYQISFNIVDQMILLTGERQGQLTGQGVQIPQYYEAPSILISDTNSMPLGSNFKNVTKFYWSPTGSTSTNDYEFCNIACLLNDNTIKFYEQTNDGTAELDVSITLPSGETLMDISYMQREESSILVNYFLIVTQSNKLYVYSIADNTYTLSTTVNMNNGGGSTDHYIPEKLYTDSRYIYVGRQLGYISLYNKSTLSANPVYTLGAVDGSIKKMFSTSNYLIILSTDGYDNFINNYDVATLSNVRGEPISDSYYISHSKYISDMDLYGDFIALSFSMSVNAVPTVLFYYTINDGESYSTIPQINKISAAYSISFLRGHSTNGELYAICTFFSNAGVYKITSTYVEAFTTISSIGGRDISWWGNITANSTLLTFDETTQAAASYSFTYTTALAKTPTEESIRKILDNLTYISKYAIAPIPDDYKNVPYDIKVGASATVWDLLNNFQQILSTWQFYFDLDGVFRIEPVPSGEQDLVYPLNEIFYISDRNDYDFNNVKNQVVVYGKQNTAFAFTDNVSINSTTSTLQLSFDDFNTEALTLKAAQIAFQPVNITPDVNMSTVIFSIKDNWTSQLTDRTGTSNYFYYINNIWFWLNQKYIYKSSDATSWSQVLSAEGNGLFKKIISNGSTYVAISTNDIYYSTNDGDSWSAATINNLPSGAELLDADVDSANNVWRCTIKGAAINAYLGSSDGQTWTYTNSVAHFLSFVKLKYSNGLWVGVTNETGSYSSYNGIYVRSGSVWTGLLTPDIGFASLAYVNNMWFAGGGNGIYYSTNGTDWNHIPKFTECTPKSFAYGNGVYVAGISNRYVAGDAALLYSSDGINWERTNSRTDNSINYVNFSNGYFVAFGDNEVYVSSNGIDWVCARSSNYSPYAYIYENNLALLASSGPSSNNIVFWKSINPQENLVIKGSLCSFEGINNYVSSNNFVENEIYTLRVFDATIDSNNKILIGSPITFELYSRLQPRWCLVDNNIDSPFYINRELPRPNFYAGMSHIHSADSSDYDLWLENSDEVSSIANGTYITFMAHANNVEGNLVNVYNSDGTVQFLSGIPIVSKDFINFSINPLRASLFADTIFNDYTIITLKYDADNSQFIYQGVNPGVYSLVLSGGEYDNIHSDQLAYERCLWELYQHTNLQDNLTLGTVADYAIDVNTKIPYNPAATAAQGVTMPSESLFFLTKQITYPLGFDATPQQITAIRIYGQSLLNQKMVGPLP